MQCYGHYGEFGEFVSLHNQQQFFQWSISFFPQVGDQYWCGLGATAGTGHLIVKGIPGHYFNGEHAQ